MPNSVRILKTIFSLWVSIFIEILDCSTHVSTSNGSVFYSVTEANEQRLVSNYDIYSTDSWCADTHNKQNFMRIDLQDFRLIAGIVISGNPNADSWVTQFRIKIGHDKSATRLVGVGAFVAEFIIALK